MEAINLTESPEQRQPEKLTGRHRAALILGLLVLLPGLLLCLGFFCAGLTAIIEGDEEAYAAGLIMFLLAVMGVGGGISLIWAGTRIRRDVAARPFRLWSPWVLAGLFGLTLAIGLVAVQDFVYGLLFPPVLLVAATLPPLIAVAWFNEVTDDTASQSLTWRRAILALVGGGTLGVLVALILEILFPAMILALVAGLAELILHQVEILIRVLSNGDVAEAVTGPGFIYIFIGVAIIAPLAEEFAKPLIVLPWARQLSKQGAFLFGALAGAGFAAVENALYAGFGLSFWAGILLVRALGGAIHPFGAGLVALGWRDLLQGEPQAGANWLARFGLAAGMHALWNGGSLLVITLAGARFFGELPPEIDVLGLSAAGTTLALLLILGLVAMFAGRAMMRRLGPAEETPAPVVAPVISDRTLAIWALACLAAIVPAGIAGLQLWLN